jgi:hypothetical protein
LGLQIAEPNTDYTHERFTDQVLRFIIACRLPFRTVEHIQFKRMLNMVKSSHPIIIPNRLQLKERLIQLSYITHTKLISCFPDDAKMSIALDCWTSPDQKPFMAITGYFISDNFQHHEILLAFPHVPGSHTGENLAKVVLDVLARHNLSRRILAITTDNASNNGTLFQVMTKALKEQLNDNQAIQNAALDQDLLDLVESQHHLPCLAHVIQLAVKAFLQTLKIEATNDAPDINWEDGEERVRETGLLGTLQKVNKYSYH